MALLLLTGMRDAAAVSLKIKHISIERGYVFQDPREVNTKFSKTIETFFFPVGYDVVAIVNDWVNLLTSEKLFSPNDPLFPKTLVEPGEQRSFEARGLSRKHWADASPVRAIFKAAFARIGLPYFKPHTVRDTLTQLAYRLQLSTEVLKAWSQNMGHSNVLTTLQGYGHVSAERQGEILAALPQFGQLPPESESASEIAAKLAKMLSSRQHESSWGPPCRWGADGFVLEVVLGELLGQTAGGDQHGSGQRRWCPLVEAADCRRDAEAGGERRSARRMLVSPSEVKTSLVCLFA